MDRTELKKRVVTQMIKIYCTAKHGQDSNLCDSCKELLAYSIKRTESCKNKDQKVTCRKCTSQCYSKDMKSRIREVMRFSGPRFFVKRPIDVIRYIL